MTRMSSFAPKGRGQGDVVDPRDWNGFDVKGNNSNSAILAAALLEAGFKSRPELGFGTSKRLVLPSGRIAFDTPLTLPQNIFMDGTMGVAGGTELWFDGGSTQDAFVNVGGAELSMCRIQHVRVQDKRVGASAGRAFTITDFNNGVVFKSIQAIGFPQEQIYVGAAVGQASDCIEFDDVWVLGTGAAAKGILLERCDNTVFFRNIKSDLATSPANDGYVIRIQNIASDNTAITIAGVKHESDNKCPTISLPMPSRGNLTISNVVQRNPQGGAAGAGDIIQIGAAASANAMWLDNTSTGRTTGSTSESGARLTLENISGSNHSDWAGAYSASPNTTAATVRLLGSSTAVCGYINRATFGVSGRITREVVGNGAPNSSVFGNVGDKYTRLDASSSQCTTWTKQNQGGTNLGWVPLTPDTQSVAYAATVTPSMLIGNRIIVGALTGNITVGGPSTLLPPGTPVIYEFTQDATGGRTLAWGSLHKGAWPTASGTANQKQSATGYSDGNALIFTGASGWY
jgi:hypothetical protein